eukprot:scaffold6119_cov115-Skeletonema_menzelii.AAC.3
MTFFQQPADLRNYLRCSRRKRGRIELPNNEAIPRETSYFKANFVEHGVTHKASLTRRRVLFCVASPGTEKSRRSFAAALHHYSRQSSLEVLRATINNANATPLPTQ